MNRSYLFVPADSERKLAKAEGVGSDALILDLEDAVAKGYVRGCHRVLLGAFGVGLKVGAMLLSPIGDPGRIVKAA